MVLTLYTSSVSSNRNVRHDQERIKFILDSRKIEYEEKDITLDDKAKEKMKELAKGKTCPVLCNDDEFIADLSAVEEANDSENAEDLKTLLKLI